MRTSFVGTTLLALLGASAIACGQPTDSTSAQAASKSTWSCGSSDVPGGDVVHCTQSALVIDTSITMTDPCEGTTDNPELCTSYTCTAGEAGCPSTTDTTTATTDTSTGTTTGTTGSSTGTGTTDTTGSTTGTTGDTTGTSGTSSSGSMSADVGGSTPSKPGNGVGRTNHVPDECTYVDTCSAGGYSDAGGSSTSTTTDSTTGSSGSVPTDSTGSTGSTTDCTKNNCNAPGVEKKTTTGSSTTDSSSVGGSSTGSTSKTQYKCAKDKDGNRVCETLPTCVAGSHPAKCGACVPDGESDDCVSPAEGGCWVTGGGFIEGPNLVTGAAEDGHDNFGGNAKPMKDGRIQGHWNHVDHGTGNHAKGEPAYIVCRHVDEPGPGGPGAKKGFIMNQIYFGGPAQWDEGSGWQDGYWFDVVAKDHGEPGSQPSPKNGFMVDTYHFSIRKQDDPTHQASGTLVYATKGGLVGGNIQMHPPNTGHPYTPGTLPSWVSLEP